MRLKLFLFLLPLPVAAIPITAGSVIVNGSPGAISGPFTITADDFTLYGSLYGFGRACNPFCPPGTTASTVTYLSGVDTAGGPGIIAGTLYPSLSYGDNSTNFALGIVLNSAPFLITEAGMFTQPFTAAGSVTAYVSPPFFPAQCILCKVPVTGQGTLIITVVPAPVPEPNGLRLALLDYVFQGSAAQVPEPSTFWLCAALAPILRLEFLRRRRRLPI